MGYAATRGTGLGFCEKNGAGGECAANESGEADDKASIRRKSTASIGYRNRSAFCERRTLLSRSSFGANELSGCPMNGPEG